MTTNLLTLYNEDCLETMSRLADGYIDCILADYPFNSQDGRRVIGGWHPQALPLDLVTSWVSYTTLENDIVYDPFTGSGTTIIACKRLNRRFIGSEISKKYFNMASAELPLEDKKNNI